MSLNTKNYQIGYINGYLQSLNNLYDLRFGFDGDFGATEASFAHRKASTNLYNDVLRILIENHTLSSANNTLMARACERLHLVPLNKRYNELIPYVEPWVPGDDFLTIAQHRKVNDNWKPRLQTVAEELFFTIYQYVLGDTEKYNYWLVEADDLLKLYTPYYLSSLLLVFESKEDVFVLTFIQRNIYP
ncbi:hypothetical protein [Solitalea canadensis]|uniref:Uncharacterized protein n=1 Tax=Solitalea canadensis (strain ATCC 29591 / DSM 3403 / JCM 21819 / LMG 8368 / NBRC 15130 / NCIMB 12057 / USAM 9D) TaxID=929556 RepID=H8KQ09_SOLCM|nr:hypothetical protein [Solitalea canadensis]AFD06118.1 hypothetical protein Solca_1010 [Solitalea canadensis DSM 3403]